MGLDPQTEKRMDLVNDQQLGDRLGLKDVALGSCLVVLSVWLGGLLSWPVLEHSLVRVAVCVAGVVLYWRTIDWYEHRYGTLPSGVWPETFTEKLPFVLAGATFIISPLYGDSFVLLFFMVVVYSASITVMMWMIVSMVFRLLVYGSHLAYKPHFLSLMISFTSAGLVSSVLHGGWEARTASIALLVLGFGVILFGIFNHRNVIGTLGLGSGATNE